MSVEAITWAFKLKLKSSAKFVLVCLCDCANGDGIFWPSLALLQERTCLDRKTIISAIDSLERDGYIIDTGRRKGGTGQIKVYSLACDLSNQTHYVYRLTAEDGRFYIGVRSCYGSPEKDEYMGSGVWPKNCETMKIRLDKEILSVFQTRKQAEEDEKYRIAENIFDPNCQNRANPNSSKNGTVKKREQNSSEFPIKEYRFSHQRVPKTEHGTVKEPSKNQTPYIPQTGDSSEEENPKIEETLETSPLDKQKQNPELPLQDKKQVDVQTSQSIPPAAASVIDYLNERTGKSYRPVKANLRLVCGRLKEGYTVDDLRRVIDLKTEAWGEDEKMREYLRPATLFGALNFAQYSAEPVRAKKEVWEL